MPQIYSIRDEYKPRFGRQFLTIWSGSFASNHDGQATELPGHTGYLVRLDNGDMFRVLCQSPRTADNHLAIDSAINTAINTRSPIF